ncbi:MAG: hypothetical protein JSS72_07505 [Armatimonadetes bacterium]|nr:hypothetical protein [Armatimonadota bacterium]
MEIDFTPEFIATRPVISLEEWLDTVFACNEYGLPEDHFETRDSYGEYIVWTWENPGYLLRHFGKDRITQGLEIQDNWARGAPYFADKLKLRALEALPTLFFQLFGSACEPFFDPRSIRGSMEGYCYMWCEVPHFPYLAYKSPDMRAIAFHKDLQVVADCLKSKNPTLWLSAIHALGHEISPCDDDEIKQMCQALLQDFIARNRELPDQSPIQYAERAMTGDIQ